LTTQYKRYNIHRQPHSIRMSDRTYVLARRAAEKHDLSISDYFAMLVREDAGRTLTDEERAQADHDAQELLKVRQYNTET
jgi:uncharacterized protein (DUF1778 family)